MKVLRSLTVEYDYWVQAQDLVRKKGISMSSLIDELLKRFIEENS